MLDKNHVLLYLVDSLAIVRPQVESCKSTRQYPVYLGRLLFGGLEPTGFLVARLSTNNNLPFLFESNGAEPKSQGNAHA